MIISVLNTVAAVLLVLAVWIPGHGQTAVGANVVRAESGCEMNSLYADIIYQEIGKENVTIFVIAQAGTGESESLNRKRLSLVRAFLKYRKGWDRYKPIYAIGDPTTGQGKINVYVGRRLYWVILAKKNEGPCMDCCDGDFLSTPGNLLKTRKKTPRKIVKSR